MYVIAMKDTIEEYYTGKKYMHQGEHYASIDNVNNAKMYKSLKVAQRSLNSIKNTCAFGYEFYIKEIK